MADRTVFDNPLPGVPLIESPFFERLLPGLPEEIHDIAKQLHDKGYAVFDFPDSAFIERAERIKQDLQETVFTPLRNADSRVQDAWNTNADVKAFAVNPQVISLLSMLYGRRAIPFQTLNFRTGSQQHYHSDTVHFSSNPERFMCGVWLALEDVTELNGPLLYYPGSHKWLVLSNEAIDYPVLAHDKLPSQSLYHQVWAEMIKESKIQPQVFLAKKGQALIWTSNLLHGGMPIINKGSTRWSQVTHYYFDGCSYYTPMLSNVFSGAIHYRNIIDIATGDKVPNLCCGQPVTDKTIQAALNPANPANSKPVGLGSKFLRILKFVRKKLRR